MDSSSDGSFAWTDASDDTTDIEMTKTVMNTSQSGEESESGKTYKKKLQQRLFSGDDNSTKQTEPHQQRKRKHSQHHQNIDNTQFTKKKKIKIEPESDVDVRKAKKKPNDCEVNSKDVINGDYDESYLDLKVKEEQYFALPTPAKIKKSKRKHPSRSSAGDSSLNNGEVEESHKLSIIETEHTGFSKPKILFEDEFSLTEEDNGTLIKSQSKKKSKKKRERSVSENQAEEISSSEEAVPEPTVPLTLRHTSSSTKLQKGGQSQNVYSKNEVNRTTNGNIGLNGNRSPSISNCSVSDNSTKRKPTISERLKFEDEDDSDPHTETIKTPKQKANHHSSKLKHFIESSLNLRNFCTKLPNAAVLTEDDDVWLIRCPKDVKIEDFQDKKWTLDSKCKIKLDGQTYEGDVDDKKRNMAILSADTDSRAIIKNVTVNGCVRLRRRIPKAHIQEDNMMVNNQNNFIPLPETKCRHPLFGLHYRRAIKLPSAVEERLRASHRDMSASPQKRKRKKKQMETDEVSSTKPKEEPPSQKTAMPEDDIQTIATSKKKKKRRHSESADELSAPKRKRVKHDLESAEAWESEQAIEENLFNF